MQDNDLEGQGSNTKGLANPKQRAILAAIESLIIKQGYLPTVAEIAEVAGLASTSTTFHWLQKLEEEGYIIKAPGIHRSIRLTPKGYSVLM